MLGMARAWRMSCPFAATKSMGLVVRVADGLGGHREAAWQAAGVARARRSACTRLAASGPASAAAAIRIPAGWPRVSKAVDTGSMAKAIDRSSIDSSGPRRHERFMGLPCLRLSVTAPTGNSLGDAHRSALGAMLARAARSTLLGDARSAIADGDRAARPQADACGPLGRSGMTQCSRCRSARVGRLPTAPHDAPGAPP